MEDEKTFFDIIFLCGIICLSLAFFCACTQQEEELAVEAIEEVVKDVAEYEAHQMREAN